MLADYYKYLPTGHDDACWGLNVLNVGCTGISPHSTYPARNHPSHHNFNWHEGRVLHEYQVIYITKGRGIFESQHCDSTEVTGGSVILLFPGEKHRYKPSEETGWDEYWIGFNGQIIDDLIEKKIFRVTEPNIFVGFDENLLNLFLDVIDTTRDEKGGFQPLLSGLMLHIIGYIHFVTKRDKFKDTDSEIIVNKARMMMRSSFDQDISAKDIARDLQISYSKFRKMFKDLTGMSPGQFQIQIRIHKAKELLMDRAKSVKEIAYELNFDSSFYFCRLFKEKTGQTPLQYRENALTRFEER